MFNATVFGPRRRLAISLLLAVLGCGTGPGPAVDENDPAVYRLALEEMHREMGVEVLTVHPRLMLPPSAADDGMIRFSRYADTTTVARATRGNAHFKLCHPKPSGACDGTPATYVVLSEATETARDQQRITVLVAHGAARNFGETRFQVEFKRASGEAEWKMTASRRTK